LAFLGFNNHQPNNILSAPLVKKTISKDSNLTDLLKKRFTAWKKFYIE